jgi:hypothetical protein
MVYVFSNDIDDERFLWFTINVHKPSTRLVSEQTIEVGSY